jgi:hypothetical protein
MGIIGSHPKINEPTPNPERESPLLVLCSDHEKAMSVLKDAVLSLNTIFEPALRPEFPATSSEEKNQGSGPHALLEKWVISQTEIVHGCIAIISDYRHRCIL